MKKSLFTALLLGINFIIHAQFSVGLKSGLYLANVEMQGIAAGLEDVSDPVISPIIGIFSEYGLSDHVSVRLGVSYVKKGLVMDQSTHVNFGELSIPVGVQIKLISQYIDIPIAIKFKHQWGDFLPYITLGGGWSTALFTTLEPRVTALLDFNLPTINIRAETFNNDEFFGAVGFGVAYSTGRGSIFVEGQYQHSLETLKPNFLVDLDLKNKGFSVGIGYAMPF